MAGELLGHRVSSDEFAAVPSIDKYAAYNVFLEAVAFVTLYLLTCEVTDSALLEYC